MKGNGISVWVFEQKPGTWLFKGNPITQIDKGFPSCHLGGIYNLACGDELIGEEKRNALEMHMEAEEWNIRFPQFKVRPVRIIIDWHYRPRKEASLCDKERQREKVMCNLWEVIDETGRKEGDSHDDK